MKEFALQVSAIIGAWGASVVALYFLMRWCFDYELSYKRAAQWGAFVALGIVLSIVMYFFLPQYWQDVFSTIVTHFTCAIAIHTLFLRIDSYLTERYSKGLSASRLYVGLLITYVLMAIDTVVVIKLGSHTLVRISQVAIEYITRGAIFTLLVLEIKSKREPKEPEMSMGENYFERF